MNTNVQESRAGIAHERRAGISGTARVAAQPEGGGMKPSPVSDGAPGAERPWFALLRAALVAALRSPTI
jgi:hypothetical protein